MNNALLNEHHLAHRKVMDWLRDRINDARDSTFLGRNAPIASKKIRNKKPKTLDKLFRYTPESL